MTSVSGASSLSSFHQSEENVFFAFAVLCSGGAGLLRPGQEDDPFEDTRALTTGYFGVLYTVGKEKERISHTFTAFRLFFDWLQLYLLILNPQYGFNIDPSKLTWQIFSFIQLNAFMTARGYTFFLGCLYIFVIGLLFNVGLCVWVGYSFQNNRFDHVWPIVFLRYFSIVFYQVLDIASLTLFLMVLDCQYFSVPDEQKGINQEFGIYCWKMPNLVHVMVASISFLAFTALATGFQMAEMELNLVSKNFLAMAHSKVEVYGFLIKTIMTCASVFINSLKWMSFVQLVMSATLLWLYFVWEPHYYRIVNNIRVATYATIFYAAIVFVLMAFMPGLDQSDDDLIVRVQKLLTIALYIGTPVCFGIGWLASVIRLWRMDKILLKLKAADENTDGKDIYEFTDPRQVEILMRCCRNWLDRTHLDPAAAELAKKIMKFGLAQLPKSPYMIILHASYLIEVQNSYQSGYTQLQAAKKADPSFLERYGIFCREQQHTQKSSAATGGGQATDLVSYVEFQRNYGLVKKVHKDALLAMRYFWSCLLHSSIPFDTLSNAVNRMDLSIKQADRVYRMVLQRHSSHVKMVRLYAKFLEHVVSGGSDPLQVTCPECRKEQKMLCFFKKHNLFENCLMCSVHSAPKFLKHGKHDPWTASKWYSEAEKLDQQDEETKNNNVFGDMDLTQPGLRAALAAVGPGGRACAIVIMNAMSIIQMTNAACHELFGYTKNELRGKRVDVLIPPPFCEQHHGHVRNHITTGKEVILNRTVPQIALHKAGHIVSIQLAVTRISGVGEDAMFMGLIEATPPEQDTAMVWVSYTGNVISVDSVFTDWFGYRAEEVAGSAATSLVLQSKQMDELLVVAKQVNDNQAGWGNNPNTVPEDASVVDGAYNKNSAANLWRGTVFGLLDGKGSSYSTTMKRTGPSNPNLTMIPGGSSLRPLPPARAGSQQLLLDTATSVESAADGSLRQGRPSATSAMSMHNDTFRAAAPGESVGALNPEDSMTGPMDDRPQLRLEKVNMHHKYADPVQVELMCVNGGAASFQFYAISIRRVGASTTHPSHMMVTDPQGRICHVTEGLAEVLGASTKLLMANGIPNALQALMPEPFRQLHGTLAQSIPMLPPPPYSCRSGLCVLLNATGPQGPYPVPFKVRMKKRPGLDGIVHVSTLEERTMEQALDERRLILTLDGKGNVKKAGKSPTSLFGFDPCTLVGKNLSTFVDILRTPGHEDDDAHNLLMELLARTTVTPGLSWRVGVSTPMDEVDAFALGALASTILAQKTKPAIMTLDADLDMDSGVAAFHNIELEVQLWRAELITGVLELDTAGKVIQPADDNILYPPGLLFGVSEERMVGRKVHDYLPLGKGTKVSELFEPGRFSVTHRRSSAEALDAAKAAQRKRSSLKPTDNSKDTAFKVGPVHTMRASHFTDGIDLDLVVQAVRKPGGFYLVMHPLRPKFGRPDFAEYLRTTGQRQRQRYLHHQHHNPAAAQQHLGSQKQPDLPIRTSPRVPASIAPALEGGVPAPVPQPMQAVPALPLPPPREPPTLADVLDLIDGMQHPQADAATPAPAPDARPAGDKAPTPPSPKDRPSQSSFNRRARGVRFGEGDGNEPSNVDVTAQISGPGPSPMLPASSRMARTSSTNNRSLEGSRQGRRSRRGSMDMKRHDPAQQDRIKAWILSNGASYPIGTIPENEHMLAAHPKMDLVHAYEHQDSDPDVGGGHSAVEGSEDEEGHNGGGRKPSGDGGSSSKRDSDDEGHHDTRSEVDLGSEVGDSDYRRGRRFKKLMRILSSAMVQRNMRRFRIHAISLVLILLAIHVGMFILMYVLINTQTGSVQDLNSIGLGAVAASQLAVTTRDFNILYGVNLTQPWLPLLTGPSDIDPMLALYKQQIDTFLELHTGVYLGFRGKRRLPTSFGIRDLWEKPTLVEVQFFNVAFNESLGNFTTMSQNNVTSLVSLWDAGNHMASAAHNIWQNVVAWNASGQKLMSAPDLLDIIQNAPNAVIAGYLLTMDDMVQLVIQQAQDVNNIQLIVLAMEGCIVCFIIVTYVWILSTQVARQRYNIYTVFMVVPITLIRTLATKRLNLSNDSDDDDDDELEPAGVRPGGLLLKDPGAANQKEKEKKEEQRHAAGSGKPGATADAATPHIQIHVATPTQQQMSFFARMAQLWHTGSLRNKVVPVGKRQLQRSIKTSIWLTWMFLLWGALIIISNAIGHTMLAGISGPIALFNIVNFVTVLYQRNMFYIQELVFEPNPANMDRLRANTVARITELRVQYNTMLYGGEAYPNETTPHFQLVTQGITYSAGRGADILFYTTDCLCIDPVDCQPENSTFYELTRHGLDRMMQKYLQIGDTIDQFQYLDPYLNGPEFEYYWVTRADMTGGLSALNNAFHDTVVSVYNSTLSIHMVSFALTWVMMLSWLFLIMRPFLQKAANETRRIAELLSQLPAEVDVEGLLNKTLLQRDPALDKLAEKPMAKDGKEPAKPAFNKQGSTKSVDSFAAEYGPLPPVTS